MKKILSIAFLLLMAFGQVGIHYAHRHGEGVEKEQTGAAIHTQDTFCPICAYKLQLGSYHITAVALLSTFVFAEAQNSFEIIFPFVISSLQLKGRAPPVA